MGHSPNSLKGVISGIRYGSIIGFIKGDTKRLDYGSYGWNLDLDRVIQEL